jgi:hypothetical protein
VYFEALRHIQTRFEWSASAHAFHLSFVLPRVVNGVELFSFSQELDELIVSTVGVGFAFANADGFFFLGLFFVFDIGLHH